jgi:hypothetical protein
MQIYNVWNLKCYLYELLSLQHYLDLDMTKYQGNMYVNLDDMDDDMPI